GCELCVLHCPSGALKSVKGQVKISNDLCTGCGYCNELCPIGEYVLIAQNFSEIAKI
ncbi:MAG TPA: 4Fe-4S dicluster domain-containing protein, partial [Thermofilum sp.]|nr:4Fe-4S dicluster domain-containing protein [Thermofilum sp.]